MNDAECVAFLQWALPRLGLRWEGFRNVRGQVCKRIRRRISKLGLGDMAAYRACLTADPAEWRILDDLCVVTISRFYRDRVVWDLLRDEVLPVAAQAARAARDEQLRCWSVGCASGEEGYTLSILWSLSVAERYPGLRIQVVATDVEEQVLERARAATYVAGTLRDLPDGLLEPAFERRGESFALRERFRDAVELRRQDVRRELPDEVFRLILCRNVVFTYFDEALQRETLARLLTRLAAGGAFLVGQHERLPPGAPLEPWHPQFGIYRYAPSASERPTT
jgi:chemotaxis protein methyltransferase CheR